jgi:uncharacterized protein (DUF1330 family)
MPPGAVMLPGLPCVRPTLHHQIAKLKRKQPMLRQAAFALSLLLVAPVAFAQSKPGPVYLVAEFEITDPAGFKKFGEATNPIVKSYGGEFLSRLNKVTPAVGDPPKSVTIVSFPRLEKAQEYFASPEYKALVPNRDKSAKFRSYLVQSGDLASP